MTTTIKSSNHATTMSFLSTSFGPFPPSILREINQYPGNQKCCDCLSLDTDWASINHGTLICLDCAGKHRSLGVQVSFVRSIHMDTWSPLQLEMMRQGGNGQIRDFFKKLQIDNSMITTLYSAKGAIHYREKLRERVEKILSGEIPYERRMIDRRNISGNNSTSSGEKKNNMPFAISPMAIAAPSSPSTSSPPPSTTTTSNVVNNLTTATTTNIDTQIPLVNTGSISSSTTSSSISKIPESTNSGSNTNCHVHDYHTHTSIPWSPQSSHIDAQQSISPGTQSLSPCTQSSSSPYPDAVSPQLHHTTNSSSVAPSSSTPRSSTHKESIVPRMNTPHTARRPPSILNMGLSITTDATHLHPHPHPHGHKDISHTNVHKEAQTVDFLTVLFVSEPLGLTLTRDPHGAAVVSRLVQGGTAQGHGVLIGDKVIGVSGKALTDYEGIMRAITTARTPLSTTSTPGSGLAARPGLAPVSGQGSAPGLAPGVFPLQLTFSRIVVVHPSTPSQNRNTPRTGNRKARISFDHSHNSTSSNSTSITNDPGTTGGGDRGLAVSMAEAVATAVRTVENREIQQGEKVEGKIEDGIGTGSTSLTGTGIGNTTMDGIGKVHATGGGIDEVGVRYLTSMSLDSDDGSASPETFEAMVRHVTVSCASSSFDSLAGAAPPTSSSSSSSSSAAATEIAECLDQDKSNGDNVHSRFSFGLDSNGSSSSGTFTGTHGQGPGLVQEQESDLSELKSLSVDVQTHHHHRHRHPGSKETGLGLGSGSRVRTGSKGHLDDTNNHTNNHNHNHNHNTIDNDDNHDFSFPRLESGTLVKVLGLRKNKWRSAVIKRSHRSTIGMYKVMYRDGSIETHVPNDRIAVPRGALLAATLTEADDRLFSEAASAAINRYHPIEFSHTNTPESSFHDLKTTLEYLVSGQQHLNDGDGDDDGLVNTHPQKIKGTNDSEMSGEKCDGGKDDAVSFPPPQPCDEDEEDDNDGYQDDSDSGMTGDGDDDDDNNNSNKNNQDDEDMDDDGDDMVDPDNDDDNNDGEEDDGYAIALASQPPTPITSRDYRVTFLSKPLGITLSKATNGAAEVTRVVPNGHAETLGVLVNDRLVGIELVWVSDYNEAMRQIPLQSYPLTLVFRRVGF